VELSPSGPQHLKWGTKNTDYLQAMMEVTPLVDSATFERLESLSRKPHYTVWKELLRCFINYLISEDARYCKIPEHDAFISQKTLPGELLHLATNY
jgi:hypothetical protein